MHNKNNNIVSYLTFHKKKPNKNIHFWDESKTRHLAASVRMSPGHKKLTAQTLINVTLREFCTEFSCASAGCKSLQFHTGSFCDRDYDK